MDGFIITSKLMFNPGKNSSNFNNLKEDLIDTIADSLENVNRTMITLKVMKVKTRFRKMNAFVVVVVTIKIPDGDVAEKTRDHMRNQSFAANVNQKISKSKALKDTGVELDSVPEVKYEVYGK